MLELIAWCDLIRGAVRNFLFLFFQQVLYLADYLGILHFAPSRFTQTNISSVCPTLFLHFYISNFKNIRIIGIAIEV